MGDLLLKPHKITITEPFYSDTKLKAGVFVSFNFEVFIRRKIPKSKLINWSVLALRFWYLDLQAI